MIIISDKPGQLCNQLIIHSNLWVFCKTNKKLLFNPSLYNYKGYFQEIKIYPGSKTVFLFFNFIARIARKLKIKTRLFSTYSIGYEEYCDLDSLPEKSSIFSHFCLAMGWQFRSKELTRSRREEIIKLFQPSVFYKIQIEKFISKIKTPKSILIGVHVRRGDYATFEGGKYFYDLESYKQIIFKTSQLFSSTEIKFILSSNDQEFIRELKDAVADCVITPGHELIDLYCLSQCNYILGPPSTYSIWASYYGKVPLYMIKNPTDKITLDAFKVIECF
jgi:hypothetical protein